MDKDKAIAWVIARLQEPSTWVGIGSAFAGIGVQIAPDQWQAITGIGLGIGGLLAAVLKEKTK